MRRVLAVLAALAVACSAVAAVAASLAPLVQKAAKGERCVEDTATMRRNHMRFLEHQRDETVHGGIRGAKHSLRGCIDCHASADTKLECEQRLAALADEMGHRLVIARLFGLIAPRQPPNYVLPGLIRRVLSAEAEGVPGLSFVRDYLDARDVCDCLLRLALSDREVPVVVNVCSGEPTSLRDLLVAIARCARPADYEALLARASEAPARPDDIRWIVGDPSLLVQVTGRAARRIPIVQTVADAVAVAGEAS